MTLAAQPSLMAEVFAAIKARLFPRWGGTPTSGDWNRYHGNYRGTNVDYAEAAGNLYQNSTVAVCLAWIQSAFPEAELQVVTLDGPEANPEPAHALVTLLERPNPFTGGDLFWQNLLWDLLLGGNAYAVKVRAATGAVRELWNIPRQRMVPTWRGDDFITAYRQTMEGQETVFPPEDVLHFRMGRDPQNERLGYSPLASCLREIATLNEGANYTADILRNGAVGSHLVSAKEKNSMTPEQAAEMETRWLNKLRGGGRGKPLFSSLPADVHNLNYSPADLDLGRMTDAHSNMVCAAFGLPAMIVGVSSGEADKTYANWNEAKGAAMTRGVIPLQRLIAEVLTYSLLIPDFGGGTNQRCRFDTSTIASLQEDQNQRWARVTDGFQAGGMTRAAWKVALGMDADENTDNVYFVPSNGALVDASETPAEREAAAAAADLAAREAARTQAMEGQDRLAELESAGDRRALAGQAKALPVPAEVTLTDEDWRRAEEVWDLLMPEARGLLSAAAATPPANGNGRH